ncbi:MAG: hypothetical protein WD355_02290, partial [Balneolaceae bacterium]
MAKFNPVPTGQVEDTPTRGPSNVQLQPEQRRRSSDFSRAIDSGIRSVRSLGHGALAAGGAIVGADEFAEERLDRSQEEAQAAARLALRITDIREVKSLEDIADYMQGVVGTQLPIMSTLALGGPAALTARALVARQISKRAAFTGGVAGAGTAIETGAIFPEVVEEAETSGNEQSLRESAVQSLGFGTAAGSLEALPVIRLFDRMGIGGAARNSIRKSLGRNIAEGAIEQSALEAGTEAAQTVIERSARKFVNENFEIFDEEGRGELLNAAAAGGLIGGLFGGGAGGIGNLTQRLSPVDEEIADIEGEDQMNVARTRAILNNLKDIPEIQDELADLETAGVDNPDVQRQVGILGAAHSRGPRSKRETPLIIRAAAQDDISDAEIDAIREIAVGERDMDAPVREALGEMFGPDNVDSVLERVFSNETGRSADELDEFISLRNQGSIRESILGDDNPLSTEALLPDVNRGSSTLNEDDLFDGGTFEEVASDTVVSESDLSDPSLIEGSDISGIVEDQDGTQRQRNRAIVRPASGKKIPGVFRATKDNRELDVFSFNLVNRMLVKDGILPSQASTRQIAKAWVSGVASLVADHGFAPKGGKIFGQLKATDKIFNDDRTGRSVTLKEALTELRRPAKSPIISSEINTLLGRVMDSGAFKMAERLSKRVNNKKVSEGERRRARQLSEGAREQVMRLLSIPDQNTGESIRDVIRQEFSGRIPPEVVDSIDNPLLREIFEEQMQDFIIRGQESGEGPLSGFDTLSDKFTGADLTPKEAAKTLEALLQDEIENRFVPTRGGFNVPEEAAAELNTRDLERRRVETRQRTEAQEEVLLRNIPTNDGGYSQTAWEEYTEALKRFSEKEYAQEVASRGKGIEKAANMRINRLREGNKKARQIIEQAMADLKRSEDIVSFYGAEHIKGRPYIFKKDLDSVKEMHKKEEALLKEWAELVGIEVPALVDPQSILDDSAMHDTFSYMSEGGSYGFVVDQGSTGLTTDFRKGPGAIAINPALTDQALRIEVLAHELGHLILGQQFANAKETGALDAMYKEWLQWRAEQKGRPAKDVYGSKATFNFMQALIAKSQANPAFVHPIETLTPESREYLLDFQEWFADNTARWFTSNAKPQSIVEKFFSDLASMLKKLFAKIKGDGYYPAKSVENLLDSLVYRDMNYMASKQNAVSIARMNELIEQDTGIGFGVTAEDMVTGVRFSQNPYSRESNDMVRDFFKAHKKMTKEEKKALSRAFASRHVRRQLSRALRSFPDERAQIFSRPDYMLAVGFQVWKADLLDLGPTATGIFTKAHTWFYDMVGEVQTHEAAEEIFQAVDSATIGMGESAIYKVAKSELMKRGYELLGRVYDRIRPFTQAILNTADGVMHATENPFIIEIANRISARTSDGVGVPESMHSARTRFIGEYINRWHNILNQIPDADTRARVIELLQNNDLYKKEKSNNKGDIAVQVKKHVGSEGHNDSA